MFTDDKGVIFVNKERIVQQFSEINLLVDEPLMNYTFTKTGGPADILAFPKSERETTDLINYCKEYDISWTVLGNASNLIVRDGGIRGVVIMLMDMNEITIRDSKIVV